MWVGMLGAITASSTGGINATQILLQMFCIIAHYVRRVNSFLLRLIRV
jgi:hypothetical protein